MDKEYIMKQLMDYCYKDGDKVSIDIIDLCDALENDYALRNYLYRTIDREYHKQDILDRVEDFNQQYRDDCEDQELTPDINEMYLVKPEELERMVDEYEEILEDNSNWAEIVDNIIFSNGIKGEH